MCSAKNKHHVGAGGMRLEIRVQPSSLDPASHACTRDEDRAMPEAGPYSATVGCAPLGLAGGIGVEERRLGSCHADRCPSDRRPNGEEQLAQHQRAAGGGRQGGDALWRVPVVPGACSACSSSSCKALETDDRCTSSALAYWPG